MRLALWCGSYFKGFGGAEKVVNDLLNRFADLGIDTFLIASNSDRQQTHNPHYEPLHPRITVYQNSFANPFDYLNQPFIFILRLIQYFKAALQLRSFLRRNNIQIIHLHFVGFDVLLLALFRYLVGYELIITFVGSDIEMAQKDRFSRLKVRIALRCADRVTAVSQDICRKLEESYSYAKASYIPNGIDADQIRQMAATSFPGVREDNFVYCGRLVPVKRVPFLIEAFYQCLVKGCTRNLYIIGDGDETAKIRELINGYGIADRVITLGALTHRQTLAVMNRSRCLLLSSASEACPMVALESLALGKPVIAPDVGGLKELLLDRETGYLYPVERQDVLCDLIMQMADGRSPLPGASGSKASMLTLGRFRLETVIRQYLEIYQTVKPAVRDRNT